MGKVIDKEDEVIEIIVSGKEIIGLLNKLRELRASNEHTHFNMLDNKSLQILK